MRRFLRRKWLLRFALVGLLGAVVLPVGTWLYVRESARSRLAKVIRQLDESDPGWTKDDLCAARNKQLPPEDRNSFRLIRVSLKAFPPGYTNIDPVRDLTDRPSNCQLRPDELAAVKKFLSAGEPALAVARRLAEGTEGGRSMTMAAVPTNTDLAEVQDARGVVWVLQWDALAAAHAGRPADAVRSARAVLGVARAIGDEPFIVSQLIRSAAAAVACRTTERVLGLCEPKEGLAELQAELTQEADFPRLTHALRGERAASHEMFRLLDSGGVAAIGGVGAGSPGLLNRLSSLPLRARLPDDHVCSLKMMTGLIEASRRPFDEQRAAFSAVPRPEDGDRRYFFTLLLTLPVEKTIDSGLRIRGELLAVAAGVACERYRQRNGRWPESLDAIPKDILPAVPTDPLTGKPISYRRLADGVIVYSIGPDGQDDGGRFTEEADKPGGPKTRDFGIRLWDPDRRRQSPPPRLEPEGEPAPDDDADMP
ncbi:MAG TPA: hypothetical protein VFG68_11805 [Fimbriiglobus sp.]|nr:hypothetical protein [Fimbriiglobus sp.]